MNNKSLVARLLLPTVYRVYRGLWL